MQVKFAARGAANFVDFYIDRFKAAQKNRNHGGEHCRRMAANFNFAGLYIHRSSYENRPLYGINGGTR